MDRRLISSLSELKQLSSAIGKPWYSNAMLADDEAALLISEQRLSCLVKPGALLLLSEYPAQYRLHLWLAEDAPYGLRLPALAKPLVAECFSRAGAEREVEARAEQLLQDWGFHIGVASSRYSRRLTGGPPHSNSYSAAGTEFRLGLAEPQQLEALLELWTGCFAGDVHSTLPSRAELAAWLADGQVLAATAGGETTAALRIRFHMGNSSHWLVATAPPWRRLGLGNALQQWAFAHAAAQGARLCSLWVADDNRPAINADLALGFAPDGRVARQYMLDAE